MQVDGVGQEGMGGHAGEVWFCFGGNWWLLPENATLFSQARRVHLSDLGRGVTIGTKTDKGVEVVSFRTVGTEEGSRAGVGGDQDSS